MLPSTNTAQPRLNSTGLFSGLSAQRGSTVALLWVLLGSTGLAHRSRAQDHVGTFTQEAVATAHPLASAAGAEVLAAGGTAADAAAATMLALGVVSPASSGLGGGGFALYYDAESDALTFLDFRETAPAASTPDMFRRADDASSGGRSQAGGLSTGVPGEPAGIEMLLERFGRLRRSQVVGPAIRLASDGFEVNETLARQAGFFTEQLKSDATTRAWFGDNTSLEAGQRVVRPQLARTLRTFAQRGAAPFYRGAIARAIVSANQRAGGIITRDDLAGYRVVERAAVEGDRFGFHWAGSPLPSAGGFTMLASLASLEQWIPQATVAQTRDDALLHAWVESWKGPYWDRAAYLGDSDHVTVPLAALADSARVAARATMFRPTLALTFASYGFAIPEESAGPVEAADDHGTSHLCVVDQHGNVAAVTSTVNYYFGALYTAAGMVMNNEMDDFALPAGEANLFELVGGARNLPAPGKRPLSSMSPTIVFREGRPVMCAGAAGGSRIPTTTLQVAFATLVQGKPLGEAMAAPRVHAQGIPEAVFTERVTPLPEAVAQGLRVRGHQLDDKHHLGVVSAIHIQPGGIVAAGDPRAGGAPAGR